MKKNDLIAKLQKIKGNPDVVLWNGFVGDYQHLAEPAEGDLVKQTKEFYLESCRLQDAIRAEDWDLQLSSEEVKELESIYNTFSYEHNNYVTENDIKKKRYKKKRVVFISAKLRGMTFTDRGGDLKY